MPKVTGTERADSLKIVPTVGKDGLRTGEPLFGKLVLDLPKPGV